MDQEQIEELVLSMRPSDEQVEENRRLREIEKSIENKPVSEWPQFEILWDFSFVNIYRFADGGSFSQFNRDYPDGIHLAYVRMEELDSKLMTMSSQTADEFWEVGFPGKKSGVIVHWLEGNKMTPCKIKPHNGQLIICGGNHRLAVCRAKSALSIPILFNLEHKAELEKIIPLADVRVISSGAQQSH